MIPPVDVELLGLIAVIIAVLVVSTRFHSQSWRGRPNWQYRRVFSVGFGGLLFFVSGLLGLDLSRSHGLFQGATWVEGPVWWQVGLGSILLTLAIYWALRIPPPQRRQAH